MRAITGLVLAVSLAASTAALADWPRFMGPDGTGIAPATEKISKTFPADGPKELWHLAMAGGYASPTVVGGKVYLLDRPDGGTKEVFSVVDLATGKVDWSVESDSQPFKDNYGVTRGTPAVDGTMAYTIGVTGDVLAIDLTAKKVAWKKNLVKDFGAKAGGWGFATSPVVVGDKLIVDASGSRTVGVVALNKKTGAQIWASSAFGAANTYTTPVLVTIDKVEQLLAWHNGKVAGIATADGKMLWGYDWKTTAAIPDPVYVGNGRIYCTTGYGAGCAMLEVKASDQGYDVKEVFKNKFAASRVSNAIFYKGYIYTNGSERDAGLQCADPEGSVKWTSKQQHFGMGSMIIADDTIVMMNSKDGTLFLIAATPDGYKELAKAKVLETSDVFAPLVLAGGKLLVRDQKTLKCLDVSAK